MISRKIPELQSYSIRCPRYEFITTEFPILHLPFALSYIFVELLSSKHSGLWNPIKSSANKIFISIALSYLNFD